MGASVQYELPQLSVHSAVALLDVYRTLKIILYVCHQLGINA